MCSEVWISVSEIWISVLRCDTCSQFGADYLSLDPISMLFCEVEI